MSSPILAAIQQICDEKGISKEAVIETIETALAAAYRKDFGQKNQNIQVTFNAATGESEVFDVKTVVEAPREEELEKTEEIKQEEASESEKKAKKSEKIKGAEEEIEEKDGKDVKKDASQSDVLPDNTALGSSESTAENKQETVPIEVQPEAMKFNPRLHLTLEEAQLIKKDAQLGDVITVKLDVPAAYGRMAAQTAKQVIIQKLREVERNTIYEDFKTQEGDLINGVIQRREGRNILVDLGRTSGILPQNQQISHERYYPGTRMKFYVLSVLSEARGPQIILSRSHEEIVRRLFNLEIPEIVSGAVEINSIAREAGARSKVAVSTDRENIDPIGSCVGQRGTRVQAIIGELGGEKVDIIQYDSEAERFIANALSPAHIIRVELSPEEKKATAIVHDDQLSLAIGKTGQNVRLAAKLTGWKIDIKTEKGEKAVIEGESSEEKTSSGETSGTAEPNSDQPTT